MTLCCGKVRWGVHVLRKRLGKSCRLKVLYGILYIVFTLILKQRAGFRQEALNS